MFPLQPSGPQKADCPEFMRGAVREPAPRTLRFTDGHESRMEVLVVRSRALQSHVEGIRVPSVDDASMYFIPFLVALTNCVYHCMYEMLCGVYLNLRLWFFS